MDSQARAPIRGMPVERGPAGIREVRKRSSRIVPFDRSKIADAIYAAFRAVGEGDRTLAEELASAVTHFLEEKFVGVIPGIEDIQDLVETVLIQLGHARVAKEYILYRNKRAMMRETLQVRKVAGHQGEGITYDYGSSEGPDASTKPDALPEVDLGPQGISSWHKSRIAAALIREADLEPFTADEIASSVERKVLHSGVKRISTSFIRELVDNELFERGFSAKLKKQAPIGIPKYNLESLIFGTDSKEGFTFPKTPVEVRNTIANRILHQYSLEEVFTPSVADAHREGRIFLHRLSDPIRLASLRWHLPPPSCLAGGTMARAPGSPEPGSYLDARDFFRKIAHLAHFFSEDIRIAGLPNLLLDPALKLQSPTDRARAVLERLSQMEERPGIALELDLTKGSAPWLDALLAHTATQQRRFQISIRLFHEISAQAAFAPGSSPGSRRDDSGPQGRPGFLDSAMLGSVAKLYERGERIEILPGFDSSRPEARPRTAFEPVSRLEACGAKITINLPRAAYRSAQERGGSIDVELEEALDLAIKGHLERRTYLERLGSSREGPLHGLLGASSGLGIGAKAGVSFSIGILGLNECVKFLSGSDLHVERPPESSALRLGHDIVRTLERKLRREEKSLGLRLELEETVNTGPLRVLEQGDRTRYPGRLAEVERGRQIEWGPTYTDGVRLHRKAPVDPLCRVEALTGFLRHVRTSGGIIEDFQELRSSSKDLLVSLLEECLPVLSAREPGES